MIAVCYGLARYAYGLFVPRFQAELALSSTQTGVIGGLSHVGYALGLVAAPSATRRFGAGRVAIGAVLVAAVGLGTIAVSVGPTMLGVAVLVAGLGSGLASPALAQVVVRQLPLAARSPAQTWINSGTSLGLAISAPAILLALHWRTTWALFGAVGLVVAVATRSALGRREGMPAGPPGTSVGDRSAAWLRSRGLVTFAFVLGMTSAGYWTFSRQRVLESGLSEGGSVGFWVVIGLCGLAGGSAGAMADRIGLSRTLQVWSLLWAGALAVLALPTLPTSLALISAGGFGAAYMALTGLSILWAVTVYGDEAAAGVRAGFLTLGVGQAIGTPLAGLAADAFGLATAFAISAAASLLLIHAASRSRRQRRRRLSGRGVRR